MVQGVSAHTSYLNIICGFLFYEFGFGDLRLLWIGCVCLPQSYVGALILNEMMVFGVGPLGR